MRNPNSLPIPANSVSVPLAFVLSLLLASSAPIHPEPVIAQTTDPAIESVQPNLALPTVYCGAGYMEALGVRTPAEQSLAWVFVLSYFNGSVPEPVFRLAVEPGNRLSTGSLPIGVYGTRLEVIGRDGMIHEFIDGQVCDVQRRYLPVIRS